MKDRTPLMILLIVVLTAAAAYINIDFYNPDYEHPRGLIQKLAWQGEQPTRGLELRRGLDLEGGLQVLLQAAPDAAGNIEEGDMELAATIIENRVNTLGVTEPVVQTQGSDKIVVELPGVEDPELAVRTIGDTAMLEFIYAENRSLFEGDEVATTWSGETPTLYGDLPEDKRRVFVGNPSDPLGQGDASEDDAAEEPESDDAADAAEDAEAASDEADADSEDSEADSSDADEDAASEEDSTETDDTDSAEEDSASDESESASEDAEASDEGDEADEDAADDAGADDSEAADEASEESEEDDEPTSTSIYPTVITGEHVANARAVFDPTVAGGWVVSFELNSEGGRRLRNYTREHVGEIMAIVVDKKIISAPTVQSEIAEAGQITGNFDAVSSKALEVQIKSGSLPVPLEIVSQNSIGPTLGEEAIGAAIRGGIVGFIAVLLFMLLYYRMPGVVANIALILYALLTLAIFRLVPVTLTLAGIAGFILSIGMAVDANILIFERMKEELRSGRRVASAMDIGFSRAWPSIRDSNISTLITCAILFWFGSQVGASIVKGFAVTLALGVITSLFTAITVTRSLLKVTNRFVLKDSDVSATEDPRLRTLFGF